MPIITSNTSSFLVHSRCRFLHDAGTESGLLAVSPLHQRGPRRAGGETPAGLVCRAPCRWTLDDASLFGRAAVAGCRSWRRTSASGCIVLRRGIVTRQRAAGCAESLLLRRPGSAVLVVGKGPLSAPCEPNFQHCTALITALKHLMETSPAAARVGCKPSPSICLPASSGATGAPGC